jgi:nitroimidazol reductase NimA-like FMN-containing flavoprotein (pyridoxamine 5'-phosphate oxidase superfamily)
MSEPAIAPGVGTIPPTDRTRLRRLRDRGSFERSTVEAILDEGLVAHVGIVDGDHPVVLPMAYARIDGTLYLHGAVANHLLGTGADGEICVTVTLLDGLVLSRSWFHHSMNYRSVVVYGRPRQVTDDEEKHAASRALVEHIACGRSDVTRAVTPEELRKTAFLALALDEASAKIRSGPPGEDPTDLAGDTWGGVLPIRPTPSEPVADDHTPLGHPLPDHLVGWSR